MTLRPASEVAEEVRGEIAGQGLIRSDVNDDGWELIQLIITAALTQREREAYERAAEVVWPFGDEVKRTFGAQDERDCMLRRMFAADIRALAQEKPDA